ncbi:hypothetical protein IFM89_004807 [Coptis chinensis]|uniref:Uncharacterized protein n=1 Tax=Coptis chinensis TaxID=261450 RepID=A0A835MHA8_9MAGN|nr:hypothetical protein IFM89_004807 [Coptis chinensis]
MGKMAIGRQWCRWCDNSNVGFWIGGRETVEMVEDWWWGGSNKWVLEEGCSGGVRCRTSSAALEKKGRVFLEKKVCTMKVVAAFQLEVLQQLYDLYLELLQKYRAVNIKAKSSEDKEHDISELSFTELRDKILALDPLDKDLVFKANQAEEDFWRKSERCGVGWNDEILGFDCGGQQWVSETCFPSGSLAKPSMQDLEVLLTC